MKKIRNETEEGGLPDEKKRCLLNKHNSDRVLRKKGWNIVSSLNSEMGAKVGKKLASEEIFVSKM